MRQGRTAAGMVIGRQRQHAAVTRGAGGVGVLEHVAAAVHARALAVPHAEHAIARGAREQVQLLRAPHRRRGQVFVHAGLEHHVVRLQVLLGLPQRLIQAAQRRTPIARDIAGRVQAGLLVAQLLQQRQAHKRLGPAQVDAAGRLGVLVIERQALGIGHAKG
ncbi:hypothetical protein G6F32_015509 [Rhizopus arrhizus]|nr:hypothetical protein G6F32_015509 [Rhizopus arrhizus]